MEGLRFLPWLQQSADANPEHVSYLMDCDSCVQTTDVVTRQCLGCPYQEPTTGPIVPWQHSADISPAPTVCPGYTTKLPEVHEIARARLYFDKGELSTWADGEPIGEMVRDGIEVLETSVNRLHRWLMKPKKDGGGGA